MIPKPTVVWVEETLAVAQIAEGSRFQTRAELLNSETLFRYIGDKEAGDKFPRIQVAIIRGKYHIIDGHHRLAVHRHLRLPTIDVLVAEMSVRTAQALAIDANATNPLPYTYRDRRTIFEAYCKSGNHLKLNGEPKSLRTISAELQTALGTRLPPSTVSTWLNTYAPRKDFNGGLLPTATPLDIDQENTGLMTDIQAAMQGIHRAYSSLTTDDSRTRTKANLESLLKSIDQPPYDPSEVDFMNDGESLDI